MNGTILNGKDIFHVHTARCGHAEETPDEEYVKLAIGLGAQSIWFTDHAPFPGDPFHNRMRFNELDEYLESLQYLKKKYQEDIHVFVGLEAEYFPSFGKMGYYRVLKCDPRVDCLLLGQHMAEDPEKEGSYTFSWDKERLGKEEYLVLGQSAIAAVQTGFFDAVAHPDRIFRRCREWTPAMEGIAKAMARSVCNVGMPLEVNMHSLNHKNYYWPEFWKLLSKGNKIILGLDAHSASQLKRRYQRQQMFLHSKETL